MDFHLDKGGRFAHVSEDYLIDEVIYSAYKIWEKQYEKKQGMNPDGLLTDAMDEDTAWMYTNSSEMQLFVRSVLENAMVNHDKVAKYAQAVKEDKNTRIKLKYLDGSLMKSGDIVCLLRFAESGAFDKVELE